MNPVEMLESMVSVFVNTTYKEVPPTEIEFHDAATYMREKFKDTLVVADEEFKQLLIRLKSNIVIRMDVGVFIDDKSRGHKSWLPARRADLDFFFWSRYKKYLEEVKHWNPRVTATLDRVSDEIVDLLGDPQSAAPFQRRGLILGDVQSGKTANYTAICNKAADTGYRVIIVMAGMMENLRKQTQERLDAEFSGRPSQYFLDPKAEQALRNMPVGVGRYGTERRIASFTSVTKDFDINILKSNNLSLHSVNDPVVLVVKKNKRILTNLISWLTANNADQVTGKISLPMLLIDDEADNASVNTRDTDNDPAAINSCIRRLLSSFRQASYVGITATPFANIFINPDSEDEMVGDDLFPRDFIYALIPPTNYIGADRIFGDDADYGSVLRELNSHEMDAFFPFSHKKTHEVRELPPSMKEAMAYFLLVNAIRDIRGDIREHRSMMIHVSRFTDVQNSIAELANEWLVKVKKDVLDYGKMPEMHDRIKTIAFLGEVWHRHDLRARANISWDRVLSEYLHRAIAPIDVRAVNQRTGASSLDYYNHRDNGLRVIAVGGNSLSRGLTLEGLCVSYFYRRSQMYDTLLQMGRWFGYRPGYDDLVKIWISGEAIDWYGYITAATNELKSEIARMRYDNLTPMEFGLKVRQDPNSLIATARNKMRTASLISRPVTVSGKLLETPRLKACSSILASNEIVFKRFVQRLDEMGRRKEGKHLFWQDVSKSEVSQLLSDFETHPWHLSFQGRALAEYIDKNMGQIGWDVVIPQGSEEATQYALLCGKETLMIRAERRFVSARNKQILISGRKVRVGAGGATAIGLTSEEREQAEAAFRLSEGRDVRNFPDRAYLIKGRRPLLMLHVIEVNYDKSDIDDEISVPPFLFALGVGFPDTGSVTRTVNYMVNMVELGWLDPEEGDDE